MRIRGWLTIGALATAGMAWVGCGSDDAAVNGTDSGASDATTGDASSGDSGGSDAGTNDSGNTDSGGGCDAGPFPSLPPGKIVCPGSPTGDCDSDASVCCTNHCEARASVCAVGGGFAACERATDCATGICCAKFDGELDLDAAACPPSAKLNELTCAASGKCAVNAVATCASSTECDGGTCVPLHIDANDGGTVIGVCSF